MKTLMSIKEQNQWLLSNWQNNSFSHKWSCRGMGNSRIINSAGEQLARATGSGYDRFGSALGDAVGAMFPSELLTLARRECKGKRDASRCGSVLFYGLFLNKKESTGMLDSMPENLQFYFDFERFGRDLVMDFLEHDSHYFHANW